MQIKGPRRIHRVLDSGGQPQPFQQGMDDIDRAGLHDGGRPGYERELIPIMCVSRDSASLRIALDVGTQRFNGAHGKPVTYCMAHAMLPSVSANSTTLPTSGISMM